MNISIYSIINYWWTFELNSYRWFHLQAEEEARSLQKKIQTVENELDQTQEALTQVNAKLDEKNKALQNVSTPFFSYFIWKKCENVKTNKNNDS